MNKKIILETLLFFCFIFKGWSQEFPLPLPLDEVYVTSSRFELSDKELGKSIIKITSKEIEQNQKTNNCIEFLSINSILVHFLI